MPFREKSAWVMAAIIAVTAALYAALVAPLGGRVPPLIVVVLSVIVLAVLSVFGQIAIALLAPRDAGTGMWVVSREGERDDRSGRSGAGDLGDAFPGWVSSVTFVACLYDGGGCVFPADNLAQFALDNIAVPTPATWMLVALALGAGGAVRRRVGA